MMKKIFNLFITLLIIFSCTTSNGKKFVGTGTDCMKTIQYKKWHVSEPVFEKGPAGSFDEISVKDPSIVFYNKRYHMFYTTITGRETRQRTSFLSKGGAGLGYVSAESIEKLNEAERFSLSEIHKSVIIAPQVFYFEPQKLWYIIAQTASEGRPDLQPVFMTNSDIENVYGWSKPEIIKTRKSNNGFWIDFWVICDDIKAHLFYTDHEGSLFRFECPIDEFPTGYADKREETVLTERGENEIGRWRLHEASHIYYVKSCNKYLNILEAVYPHPTRRYYWESRNRFLFAMMAEKLEGPWERVESGSNEFFGDPSNLISTDGRKSVYDQVSHPELIRSGYNQKLEIDDLNLQLIFQAFDADTIKSDYDYSFLPWKLMIMKNY